MAESNNADPMVPEHVESLNVTVFVECADGREAPLFSLAPGDRLGTRRYPSIVPGHSGQVDVHLAELLPALERHESAPIVRVFTGRCADPTSAPLTHDLRATVSATPTYR